MGMFSKNSVAMLGTCHPDLQRIFYEVVLFHDCTIIEGTRAIERQKQLFASGKTKTMASKHINTPSLAVDAAPFIYGRGIPWPDKKLAGNTYTKDLCQFYLFAGIVLDRADSLGVKLRWGGDWDRDFDLADQTFDDLVHFELI